MGYSGHGFVVAEAAISTNMNLKYYSEIEKLTINPFDLEYLGFEKETSFNGWLNDFSFILGIGNNALRQKISNLVVSKNKEILNVIHSSASISNEIKIGKGNFIARNVSINPLVVIEDTCILNTGCIIEHECIIKEAAHIAPGAVLTGNVTIGERSFVGANSIIKQGVIIGKDVVIGAGSVVLYDVPDGKTVVGNPSKVL